MSTMLVIDVGTTGLRAAIIDDTLAVRAMEYRACPPTTPAPGLVEFDGADLTTHRISATPDRTISSAERPVRSWSPTAAVPVLGKSPRMALSKVDFPAPFVPSRATISCCSTWRSTSKSTWSRP